MIDLPSLKSWLDLDPDYTVEDKNLLWFIELASEWIEEILGRRGRIFKRSRTEYYNGTGTQKLPLKSRPVFTTPTIQCWVDRYGFYGQTDDSFESEESELTYGNEFVLQVDQDDGTSRSGILLRRNRFWLKRFVREPGYLSPYVDDPHGNVKVTYTAGYDLDNLPMVLRAATIKLVASIRYLFPLGMELGSESYQERSISVLADKKDYLTGMVKEMILPYRNWKF